MFLQTTGKNLQNRDKNIKLTAVPDVCTLCHRSIHPKHIITQDLEERKLCQTVFRCTNLDSHISFLS